MTRGGRHVARGTWLGLSETERSRLAKDATTWRAAAEDHADANGFSTRTSA
jgi:hypothetical protein